MSNEERLRAWLRNHLARVLGAEPATISLDRTLGDYGLDSVDGILIAGELEEKFGIEIEPATFIRFDTFESMIVALAPQLPA
jgi:acyl carrier protein